LLQEIRTISRNKKGCIEMLPRFKIQYPMKNRDKDAVPNSYLQVLVEKFLNNLGRGGNLSPFLIRTL
jgi:hypothetical protein